jgi:5-methylcytosine-specific restriction endonuclease McrA
MALSKHALGSQKWKDLRLRILARDGWQCTYCFKDLKGGDATVDHITSRKVGGDLWDMENLTSACKSCNSRKGSRFFSRRSTPPAFLERSLPETVGTKPDSPFQKP